LLIYSNIYPKSLNSSRPFRKPAPLIWASDTLISTKIGKT